MKKILIALMLMFAIPAFAGKTVSKEMLEQVWSISSGGYKPVVGAPVYTIEKKHSTIVVVRFYDSNSTDGDPEQTDMQAIFIKTKSTCKLVAMTFSPVDVTKYIDILVE